MSADLIHIVTDSSIVGALLPAAVAVVNQEHWTPRVKGGVAATLTTVAGILTAWGIGELTHGWYVSVAVVFVVASVAFQTFWRPTGWAPLIEALTSIESRPPGKAPATSTARLAHERVVDPRDMRG